MSGAGKADGPGQVFGKALLDARAVRTEHSNPEHGRGLAGVVGDATAGLLRVVLHQRVQVEPLMVYHIQASCTSRAVLRIANNNRVPEPVADAEIQPFIQDLAQRLREANGGSEPLETSVLEWVLQESDRHMLAIDCLERLVASRGLSGVSRLRHLVLGQGRALDLDTVFRGAAGRDTALESLNAYFQQLASFSMAEQDSSAIDELTAWYKDAIGQDGMDLGS